MRIASSSPAWSSTKPSSIIATLRNVSRNLTIRPVYFRSAVRHHCTSWQDEFHPPDGMKDRSSFLQEASLKGPGDCLAA